MTWTLDAAQVEAAEAWTTILGRVDPGDRRMVAIFAVDDLGNVPVLVCDAHDPEAPRSMTFTAAYRHVHSSTSKCVLRFDGREIEVSA